MRDRGGKDAFVSKLLETSTFDRVRSLELANPASPNVHIPSDDRNRKVKPEASVAPRANAEAPCESLGATASGEQL